MFSGQRTVPRWSGAVQRSPVTSYTSMGLSPPDPALPYWPVTRIDRVTLWVAGSTTSMACRVSLTSDVAPLPFSVLTCTGSDGSLTSTTATPPVSSSELYVAGPKTVPGPATYAQWLAVAMLA